MNYIIGHLVGDYLLQNDWMALNKKRDDILGWTSCSVHCLIWTLAVLTCCDWWRIDIFIYVFLSHFLLDKTYLIVWYMKKIGSFSRIINDNKNPNQLLAYIAVDNSAHLLFLFLIAKFIV